MRHLKSGRRLSRNTAQRKALMSNLCKAMLDHGRITTTLPKAKELRIVIERLVTLGKEQTVAARRSAFAQLASRTAVNKLFNEVAPKFGERKGGYTRILKTGRRVGDAGHTAIIEFVEGGASVD